MVARIDLVGHNFGRLTVVAYSHKTPDGRLFWSCQCECGRETTVRGASLRAGDTQSCGCLVKESLSKRRTTHGMRRSPEYRVWVNIIQRCTNPDHSSFNRYGGRGIAVCERWLQGFENFFEDMGHRPFPGAEIDREDNDGMYEKGNCRWVTPIANANNRSSNRHIAFNGQSKTLAQWARHIGCSPSALHARLKRGWAVADALTTPFWHSQVR